VHGMKS